MKIHFLGTRANITHRSTLHNKNALAQVSYYNTVIQIDAGIDWLDKITTMHPQAIFITHAHDDHADGLKNGTSCPVYATKETWERIGNYPIKEKMIIQPNKPVIVGKIQITAYSVEHSINAPAVGYKITAGKKSIFYVPDLVYIRSRTAALKDVNIYIGDGARVKFALLRNQDGRKVGHTTIDNQLSWCKKERVLTAYFTHCGTEVVTSDPDEIKKVVKTMGKEYGVHAHIATDGLKINV